MTEYSTIEGVKTYTITEICKLSQLSQSSFYRLKDNDKAFSDLIEQHRRRDGSKYVYDDAVLSYLTEMKEHLTEMKERVTEPETAPEAAGPSPDQETVETLSARLEALETALEAARRELETTQAEKAELLKQNGELLLLLSQEKAEKLALLPKPKLTLGQRVKRLFGRDAY